MYYNKTVTVTLMVICSDFKLRFNKLFIVMIVYEKIQAN